MATAADWMSAASFISMAGLISNMGYGGGLFLMGWTGGYVLLAMLLAPYLRKFGKFTVPQFIGDRFYSKSAEHGGRDLPAGRVDHLHHRPDDRRRRRVLALPRRVAATSASTSAWRIVFAYAVFGGMKGITYTQVAQYIVLILAYTVPAIFISLQLTGNPMPQLGLGSNLIGPRRVAAGQARPGGHRPGLRQVHDVAAGQQAEHVHVHAVADDRHRRPAARHHAILHRAVGQGRTLVGRLGAGVHRDPVHHRAGRGGDGQDQPDPHRHAGRRDAERRPVRDRTRRSSTRSVPTG